MNLADIAEDYNKSKLNSFQGKSALKEYLDPVNLYNNPPTKDYENIPDLQPEENNFFRALHFVKYRLQRALEEEKNVQFWTRIYIVLRNRIVLANMGLVFTSIKITSYFLSHDPCDNVENLKSIGTIALMRAVDKFDPWRGYKFSTYAMQTILREYSNKAKKYNHPPMLDVNEIDAPDAKMDEDQEFMIDRVLAALKKANINDRERKILDRRYFKRLILHDVAQELDLSKERVRQIQEIALEKLRETIENDPLLR